MHFKSFSIVFLLLPFTISKYENIDPSMEGLADVLLCIDIQYTGLSDKKAGFDGLQKFLKSTALHKLVHTQHTSGEDQYYKGNRLAVVKMDDKGFDVLMHFNDPSPISKLSTIADEHFKNGQNQAAPREMLLNDLFDDIRQTVFAPENGDRTAPNVMIYFYLSPVPRDHAAFHEELLRYAVDGSVRFSTYNVEHDWISADLRAYGWKLDESFLFVSSDDSDQTGLHIVVETQLQQCKYRSMYKYTKCSSMSSTNGARCIRRKVFKGDAIFPHLCWHGESPILEPCDKVEECIDKCEEHVDNISACIGPCNGTGGQIKTYRSNPINCTMKLVDCFRLCIPTTTTMQVTTTAVVSDTTSDAGTSSGVQPAGANPAIPKGQQPERPPGPRTELPQWAKGAIITCCVISGLVILGVLCASVYMAVRKAKARKESKGQRKPMEQVKGKGPGTCSVRRGG